jgi:hypothetical protein
MRTEKNIVVAGGTAAVGSAAAPYLTSQTLLLDGGDTISLMRPHSPTFLSVLTNLKLMNKTALNIRPRQGVGFAIPSQLGYVGARLIVNI